MRNLQLIFCVFCVVVSWQISDTPSDVVDFRQVTEPLVFQQMLKSRLSILNDRQLMSLVAAGDDSMSLGASWQQVITANSKQLRARKIEQFIGVANSRISELPEWWTNVVRSADLRKFGMSRFKLPPSDILAKSFHEGFSDFGTQLLVMHNGKTVNLKTIDENFDIPLAEGVLTESSSLNYLTSTNRCYFAQHLNSCYSYNIGCLDKSDTKNSWANKVWASGNLFNFGGPSWHKTELKVVEENLVVFGASHVCVYAEVFDCNTGKCKSRFSTILFAGKHSVK